MQYGWDCPIIYFKGSQIGIPNYDVFKSLKIVYNSAKNVDCDEMHHTAFHLAFHCLPKYPFRGFQYEMG